MLCRYYGRRIQNGIMHLWPQGWGGSCENVLNAWLGCSNVGANSSWLKPKMSPGKKVAQWNICPMHCRLPLLNPFWCPNSLKCIMPLFWLCQWQHIVSYILLTDLVWCSEGKAGHPYSLITTIYITTKTTVWLNDINQRVQWADVFALTEFTI